MLAMTENSRSKPEFLVEIKSSETPPPSTPETRQLTTAEEERLLVATTGRDGRTRRWWEKGGGGGGVSWKDLSERSAKREKKSALAVAAIKEESLRRAG
ncbi:hypothetical protein U1Q18_045411 [Sarracenia purpurea var. burkii]